MKLYYACSVVNKTLDMPESSVIRSWNISDKVYVYVNGDCVLLYCCEDDTLVHGASEGLKIRYVNVEDFGGHGEWKNILRFTLRW
jgi:hypothetical protein